MGPTKVVVVDCTGLCTGEVLPLHLCVGKGGAHIKNGKSKVKVGIKRLAEGLQFLKSTSPKS